MSTNVASAITYKDSKADEVPRALPPAKENKRVKVSGLQVQGDTVLLRTDLCALSAFPENIITEADNIKGFLHLYRTATTLIFFPCWVPFSEHNHC